MSFILDALNRSDSDRDQAHAVPGLQTVHGPESSAPSPLWKRLLWPLLALLFALVAAWAWWVSPPASAPAPVPEQRVAEPQKPVAPVQALPQQAPAQPARALAPQPAARQSAGQEADIAALYASKAGNPATAPAQANLAPAPLPEPVAAPTEASARAPRPDKVAEPAMDVAALARAAEAELERLQVEGAPVVEHEAPFISELRQSVKDQIPSIFYNAHNWSANPAQRSVILNKREFREGQQVKPGLKLVEILQDSSVLEFRGTEFRLKSLNSWVNL